MAPNQKAVKACKMLKSMGYSGEVVKPVLKGLLKVYNNDWRFIEDEGYRVLIDAVIESEENKLARAEREKKNALLEAEPEEIVSNLKRSRTKYQIDQGASSGQDLAQNFSKIVGKINEENQAHEKTDMAESSYNLLQDENIRPKILSPISTQVEEKNRRSSLSHRGPEQKGETQLHSDDECKSLAFLTDSTDEAASSLVSSERRIIVYGGGNHASSSKDECNALIESVLPVALVPPEFEQFKAEDKENSALNESKLDIASSSRGEVKISLTYDSPPGSHLQAPSLKSLLKHVEEKCVKSYRITQPDFSVLKVMRELCESFLEAISTSTNTEQGIPETVRKSNAIHKEGSLHAVSEEGTKRQPTFCIDSNSVNGDLNYQNGTLMGVRSQIPQGLRPTHVDLFHCLRNSDVDGHGFSNKGKMIVGKAAELESLASGSAGPINLQKQHSYYYVEDITKGIEAHKIPLINEINYEKKPNFFYVHQNLTYRKAYVKFVLARISDDNCCANCFFDCLSSELPCACAGETGGEFAYMPDGLLKENFLESYISMNRDQQHSNLFYCQECPLERSKTGKCKGHLVRRFIKECWYKCGCSMACGNRVVQRGITARLQVFMTSGGKGWGVRTLEDLPKGAFVCEYVGEVVTNAELYDRNMQNANEKHTYPVLLDADWSSEGILDEEALCLDATSFGNVARFINHRCYDANLIDIPVEVETPDHHYYHVAFFTTRKVNALEEFTWDYGIDFNDHNHPIKAFRCQCGSKYCRDQKSKKKRKAHA